MAAPGGPARRRRSPVVTTFAPVATTRPCYRAADVGARRDDSPARLRDTPLTSTASSSANRVEGVRRVLWRTPSIVEPEPGSPLTRGIRDS